MLAKYATRIAFFVAASAMLLIGANAAPAAGSPAPAAPSSAGPTGPSPITDNNPWD